MNRKKNIIYLTGGFVVFISVLTSFVILPLFLKITDRTNELIVGKRNLSYITERARVPGNGIDDLESILNEVHDFYIDPRRPVDEIRLLERLAADNDLDIEINIVPEPKEDGNWSYLAFMILIRGDSGGLINFIEAIQNSKWIAVIDRLNVRRAIERDMGQWENSVVADISLNIYFRE